MWAAPTPPTCASCGWRMCAEFCGAKTLKMRRNWNHIFKLQRQCRGPWRARKLLPLCHIIVTAPKSPSQGGAFSDQRCSWSYACRMYIQEIQVYTGRGASSGRFVPKIGEMTFFVDGATQLLIGVLSFISYTLVPGNMIYRTW